MYAWTNVGFTQFDHASCCSATLQSYSLWIYQVHRNTQRALLIGGVIRICSIHPRIIGKHLPYLEYIVVFFQTGSVSYHIGWHHNQLSLLIVQGDNMMSEIAPRTRRGALRGRMENLSILVQLEVVNAWCRGWLFLFFHYDYVPGN